MSSVETSVRAATLLDEIERHVEDLHREGIIEEHEADFIKELAYDHFEEARKNPESGILKLQAIKGLLEMGKSTEGLHTQPPEEHDPRYVEEASKISPSRFSRVVALLRLIEPSIKRIGIGAMLGTSDVKSGEGVKNPLVRIEIDPKKLPDDMEAQVFHHTDYGPFFRTIYLFEEPPEDKEVRRKEALRVLAEVALRGPVPFSYPGEPYDRPPSTFLGVYEIAKNLVEQEKTRDEHNKEELTKEDSEEILLRSLSVEEHLHSLRALLENFKKAARVYRSLKDRGNNVPAESFLTSIALQAISDAKSIAEDERVNEKEALERLFDTLRYALERIGGDEHTKELLEEVKKRAERFLSESTNPPQ